MLFFIGKFCCLKTFLLVILIRAFISDIFAVFGCNSLFYIIFTNHLPIKLTFLLVNFSFSSVVR